MQLFAKAKHGTVKNRPFQLIVQSSNFHYLNKTKKYSEIKFLAQTIYQKKLNLYFGLNIMISYLLKKWKEWDLTSELAGCITTAPLPLYPISVLIKQHAKIRKAGQKYITHAHFFKNLHGSKNKWKIRDDSVPKLYENDFSLYCRWKFYLSTIFMSRQGNKTRNLYFRLFLEQCRSIYIYIYIYCKLLCLLKLV
jgi:hypothetical protein